ncbi:MAG: YopX family protein [Sulfurimonas sp.]|nr:YopX family protein [Sulfurimonas sp.]
MREIKFRAWDEENSYMAIQGLPDLETLSSFMHHFGDFKDMMQYTGLKDKNGAEIYEGDIVLCDDRSFAHFIEWNCDKVMFRLVPIGKVNYYAIDLNAGTVIESNLEVIGNIYQNKELLNAKKEVE